MAVFQSGPTNIEQDNSATFVVEFFDIDDFLAIPSSASITVTYVNTALATQVDTVALSNSGAIFNGTWSSTSASLCLATWVVLAASSSVTQATGQLRIIERRGA